MRLATVWLRGWCRTIKPGLLVLFDIFPVELLLHAHLEIARQMFCSNMSNLFQNVPVFGKLFGKLMGAGAETGEKKRAESDESPSFPDYMLDPDAVVSVVTSHICSTLPASAD